MDHSQEAMNILELVFNDGSGRISFNSISAQGYRYHVIPGRGSIRWIVPDDPDLGRPVLSQWRPYKSLSHAQWKLLLLLYSNRLLSKIPGIKCIGFGYDGLGDFEKWHQKLIPVIYVGTPGSHQKAVATFIDPIKHIPQYVMKVALKINAREKLIRESELLEKMAVLNLPRIPKLLYAENNGMKTIQTVINGPLTSRRLTSAHVDWLLNLPKSGKITTLDEQREIIDKSMIRTQQFALSEPERQTIFKAAGIIQGNHPFSCILTHGDFAPWNLKWTADKQITAIDWEDAAVDGLPLWDLSHFFCIQGHLFGGRNPFKTLNDSPLIAYYLKKNGLTLQFIRPLYALYLMKKFISLTTSPMNSYRDFILKQIQRICPQ